MITPTDKIRNIIKLEIDHGNNNRAVVGGLDKFLTVWQRESAAAGVAPELIEKISNFLTTYGGGQVSDRRAICVQMLKSIPPSNPDRSNPVNPNHTDTQPRSNYRKPDTELPKSTKLPNNKERTTPAARPAYPSRRQKTNFPSANETALKEKPHIANNSAENQHKAAQIAKPEIEENIPPVKKETPIAPEDIHPVSPIIRPQAPDPVAAAKERVHKERENFKRPEISNDRDSNIESSVSIIPGIGIQNAKALAKQEVYTVHDFLYYFPRRYDDYSTFKPINKLIPGETVTVIGVVHSITNITRGKYEITECVVGDGTRNLTASWFNQPWLIHQIHENQSIVLSGKVTEFIGKPVMNSPEWEPGDQDNTCTNRIVPIYRVNSNLKQNFLRRMLFNTVRHWANAIPEYLPDSILESVDLLPLPAAISQIHFPDSMAMLAEARRRIGFDEIFLLQLGVLSQKRNWVKNTAVKFECSDERVNQWINNLPFQLTDAQKKAFADIRKDLSSGYPMNRLIQGDVGSGKTVIASLASLIVTDNDGQAVLMAPTSILAEQHYRTFLGFLSDIGIENVKIQPNQVELLTGATPDAKKNEILERLASGEIKILIGTHALIEDPVQFKNLELVIIDEQHRFGVNQRAILRSKGTNPHLMVMTATPIPRSLALTIYGDLDLTVIDELPKGRIPVETYIMDNLSRERVYQLIENQIAQGHQAFIIYPLVSEDDKEDNEGKAAVESFEKLKNEIFPDYRLALLYGQMKGTDKNAILEAFKNHEYDILVSTSVIEVGVDIPNATVMLIEGADHFGLAQLHQFRGRVGRGTDKSYCILIPENDHSEEENKRLVAMTQTNDGFKLAEQDLILRGPGDFLGTRQSGLMNLKIASLTNIPLIEAARKEAEKLFEKDPDLSLPEDAPLRPYVEKAMNTRTGDIS